MPPPFVIRPSYRPVFQSSRYVSGAGGIDPDAAAYIAAIEGDGVVVTPTQEYAINTFYVTGKDEGWYSALKRIYLPIWAAASPNARCMVSGTSGTFNGTVTHAAGYVQGDGSTGYFAVDASIQTILGGVTNIGGMFLLGVNDSSAAMSSGLYIGTARLRLFSTSITRRAEIGSNATTITEAGNPSGILVCVRRSDTDSEFYRRSASGFASIGSSAVSDATDFPNLAPYFAGGANNNGSLLASTNPIQQGTYGVIGTATTQQITAFSGALQTLWETCTGLTLP